MQDNKSRYLHNQAVRRANEVRQRRATVENPQWAMSRPAEWYKDRENLASIKDTLVNQQGNRDFWTTDQDESRNAYQMLMNQMKGYDRGARMMDLRGLPTVVQSDPNRYRRGRTMFQDPSKSQGFLGDVGSLLSGKNKAAVYADEYNPFPKAGFAADWYKDQFPIASGLGSLMEAAANVIPYVSWAKRFLPKSNRVPLDRDLSWVPEGLGEYDEIDEISDDPPAMRDLYDIADYYPKSRDFVPEGEATTADLSLLERFPDIVNDPEIAKRLEKVGYFDRFDTGEPSAISQEDFPFLDMINQNPRADSRIEKYIRYPEAYPEYAHLYPGLRNKSAFPGGFGELIDLPSETFEEIELDDYNPFDEDSFNSEYEFVNKEYGDRESDDWQGVSTPWEYFITMRDTMNFDNKKMLRHLIEDGTLKKKYSDEE